MESAGDFIDVLVEFAAGVELRHDDLGGGDAFFGMYFGRNAPSVVLNDCGSVLVKGDLDGVAETAERFVDGVVDDFVDHVVESRAVFGIPDVHARTLAHGGESLEDLDAFGAVGLLGCFGLFGRGLGSLFRHSECYLS